jgi:hypothetical protein
MAHWLRMVHGEGSESKRYATGGGSRLFEHYNRSYVHFSVTGGKHIMLLAKASPAIEKWLRKKKLLTYIERPSIDTAPADPVLQEQEIQDIIERFVKKHAFEETVMLAMLEACNLVMMLPTQAFLWLKPIDRTLFYTLDSLGANGGWSEGGGAIAHYRTEIFNEIRIDIPQVDMAVSAMSRELESYKWVENSPY